jgi:hypothetical protein
MPRPVAPILTILTGAFLITPSARAAGPLVALVETTSAPRDGRLEVKAAVEQALRDLGAELVPQARLRSVPANCQDADCYAGIGKATGAGFVLRLDGKYAAEAYKLRLELRDGGSGKLVASDNNQCDICTLADFYKAAKERTTVLCAQPFRAEPPASTAQPAAPPPLPVRDASPVSERPFLRQPLPVAGLAFAIVGAGLTAAGLYLLAVDGDAACAAGAPPPCARFRHTGGVGTAYVVGGLAAAFTGAALLYFGRDDPGGVAPVSVSVARESAFLLMGGRF